MKRHGEPWKGKFPGTAEHYFLTRPATLLFFALLFGWAYCIPGCSRAVDNTLVKETKVDEKSKTDATSATEGGSATEREEGPTTVTTTAGWTEIVDVPVAPGGPVALLAPAPVQHNSAPAPHQIAPGIFAVYHPPVTVTVTGPVEEKHQSWEKTDTDIKKVDDKAVATDLKTENKSSWGFLNHWYYWVAFIAVLALAGYILRKSIPILKWIP